MSYRIEMASSSRAGCTDTLCKAEGVKIQKGMLRLGTWLLLPNTDHGSWKWKHWGCTSGNVIQHIREKISNDKDGYLWDAIDGFDELGDHPDIQEKIRRVINQGHIDAEDFNGDPDFNILGSRGIRGRKKKVVEPEEGEENEADAKSTLAEPAKKTAGAKRSHKKATHDEDEADAAEPPTKKAKKTKAAAAPVKEMGQNDEEPVSKKTKKSKAAAPTIKEEKEDDDEQPAPQKTKKPKAVAAATDRDEKEDDEGPAPRKTKGSKAAATAVKYQEDDGKPASKKRGPATKAVSRKPENNDDADEEKLAPKKRGRVPEPAAPELEPTDNDEEEDAKEKPAPKKAARKSMETEAKGEAEEALTARPKKRGKKSAA